MVCPYDPKRRTTLNGDQIAVTKSPATLRLGLSINEYPTRSDQYLCLSTGADDTGPFEQCAEENRLRANSNLALSWQPAPEPTRTCTLVVLTAVALPG